MNHLMYFAILNFAIGFYLSLWAIVGEIDMITSLPNTIVGFICLGIYGLWMR